MIQNANPNTTDTESEPIIVRGGQRVTDPAQQTVQVGPYILKEDGIYMLCDGDNGKQIELRLTNFAARVLTDVIRTDGESEETFCEVETVLKGERKTFTIPAGRFNGLPWIPDKLGVRAIIEPVAGANNHVRTAIRKFSQGCGRRTVFCCTGWTLQEGKWVFLNVGDLISAEPLSSMPEVDLPRELSRYELTLPADKEEARQAMLASLKILALAEDRITVPVLAAAYRSVLGPCDLALHLSGRTGEFKSSLAALVQQHFGPDMNIAGLPASWSSTANALEDLGFTAKDVVLVVDDYVPHEAGSQQAAERLFRSQGNGNGRARMTGGGSSLRSGRHPRGLIVSTGEDTPGGQSIRARMAVVDVGRGAISQERLTQCQSDACSGLYAKAMAGFIQSLASRYGEITRTREAEIAKLRPLFDQPGQHRRTATNVASLMFGLNHLLEYASGIGAISPVEKTQLHDRFVNALTAAHTIS